MLGYKCKRCGAIKSPDGKSCQCGAGYNELEVIKIKYENFRYKEEKEY